MSKIIAVFGATGNQGSAFITALSEHNTPSVQYTILALSRDPASSSSTRLAALPGVKVFPVAKNYMDEPGKVFDAITETGLGKVYGVFSVQGYVDPKVETAQGNAIVNEAAKAGVKHFVYSSVDFGGADDTHVSGFEIKRGIENTLKSSGLAYTILHPTWFMDNLSPTSPFTFKVSRTILLRQTFKNHPERKVALISTRDTGRAGAVAMAGGEKWMGKEIRLAGDEMTSKDIEKVYQEVMGKPVELTYTLISSAIQLLAPFLAEMARFIDDNGFNVDLSETEAVLPDAETLREYLARIKPKSA